MCDTPVLPHTWELVGAGGPWDAHRMEKRCFANWELWERSQPNSTFWYPLWCDVLAKGVTSGEPRARVLRQSRLLGREVLQETSLPGRGLMVRLGKHLSVRT